MPNRHRFVSLANVKIFDNNTANLIYFTNSERSNIINKSKYLHLRAGSRRREC